MADLKKLADDATTQAALAIGKEAAKRATRELLVDDADKDKDGPIKPSKSKLWKIAAVVLVALLLIGGLVGLVLNYWIYFLAAGVLGVLGLVGWFRLKARLGGDKKKAEPALAEKPAAAVRVKVEPAEEAPAPQKSAAERRAELEARAKAAAEAKAQREAEVDEELAALKAKLKK